MTSASTFSETDNNKRPSHDDPDPVLHADSIQTLPERPLPKASQYILHGQEPGAGQVMVFHRQDALRQISGHSISNLRSEVGGVLLGRASRCQDRIVVEVQAAIPATSNDHGPIHFTFTADAWSQIHRQKAAHYPKLDIVGWFHTHPGLGVFYSSDDVVVHTAAFTLPWHVGLVVDPIRNEASYFGWVQEKLAPLDGFYELPDTQEKPVVPWRVAPTAVWHERQTQEFYASYEADEDGGLEHAYPSEAQTGSKISWLNFSPEATQVGLLAGILGLVLSFFLLVGGVLPLNRQIRTLESVALTLADEALADSNNLTCPNPQLRILTPITGSQFAAGSAIEFVGTAEQPDAARYRLETRLAGTDVWNLAGVRRWDTRLGTLTSWDTAELAPGLYEVRLTAVDRNNIRLAQAPICTIQLELTP